MKKEYNLRDITPREMQCGITMACPAIYELTPKEMQCGAMLGCSSIYGTDEESYLIIGEQVNPKDFGLEKKVGKNEILIKVPKRLIDEKRG